MGGSSGSLSQALNANTTAFDLGGDSGWLTSLSFVPTCYGTVGNHLVSCKPDESSSSTDAPILWKHNDVLAGSTTYYGASFKTYLKSVINASPFKSKNFNNISLEPSLKGNSAVRISTTKEQANIHNEMWKDYEHTAYSEIPRSSSSGSSEVSTIGTIKSFQISDPSEKFTNNQGNLVALSSAELSILAGSAPLRSVDITFNNNISQVAFTMSSYILGAQWNDYSSKIVLHDNPNDDEIKLIPHKVLSKNKIRFMCYQSRPIGQLLDDADISGILVPGGLLLNKSATIVYGDKLRDKYAMVELFYDAGSGFLSSPLELSSVNVDITESRLT